MSSDQFSDYFGMAGQLAAMSEFLLRGYDVAIPFVDRGADVLTIEDEHDEVRLVQVKTSKSYSCRDPARCEGRCGVCQRQVRRLVFSLRADQLRTPDRRTKLFFMFMFRTERHWEWILISRKQLHELRRAVEERPSRDTDLTLEIVVDAPAGSVRGWRADLHPYFNTWVDWPETGRSSRNFRPGPP